MMKFYYAFRHFSLFASLNFAVLRQVNEIPVKLNLQSGSVILRLMVLSEIFEPVVHVRVFHPGMVSEP